jgi:hypothetical protein
MGKQSRQHDHLAQLLTDEDGLRPVLAVYRRQDSTFVGAVQCAVGSDKLIEAEAPTLVALLDELEAAARGVAK